MTGFFFFGHELTRIYTNFLYYGRRGNQRKETELSTPTDRRMRPIIRFFSPLASLGVHRHTLATAEKPKSAALWLKSLNGSVPVSLLIFACWGVKHGLRGSATLVRQTCVRFRFFARCDLTRIKTASHEWATKPYNRTRILCLDVGHFLRSFRSLLGFP